jgi:hypothetical protein
MLRVLTRADTVRPAFAREDAGSSLDGQLAQIQGGRKMQTGAALEHDRGGPEALDHGSCGAPLRGKLTETSS